MRQINSKSQFTPLGIWMYEYLPDSGNGGFSITNLDYVIEDYKNKKIMLFEEKQQGGILHNAQILTFDVIDYCLEKASNKRGYDYWGFYWLQIPKGATMPGPGMRLNGEIISCEQLQNHLSFLNKFCDPWPLKWRQK